MQLVFTQCMTVEPEGDRVRCRGAMTHKGKVVTDQQGRVMGKNGKLLQKEGHYCYINDKVCPSCRTPCACKQLVSIRRCCRRT